MGMLRKRDFINIGSDPLEIELLGAGAAKAKSSILGERRMPISLLCAESSWREDKTGGRYKIRTCDPFDVNEVRYHCANRPHGAEIVPSFTAFV